MFAQILKKSLLLLIIYTVLIVGIFILQFKNDSIISEKLGTLHLTLLQSVTDNNEVIIKNKYNIIFNGLTFNCSDEKPVKAIISKQEKPLSLTSWEKLSPLSCKLNFTDDVSLIFTVSEETSHSQLSIDSQMPKKVSSIIIPYGLVAGATIASQADSKIQISNKKTDWELIASDITTDKLTLTQKESFASYSYYNKTTAFSFEMTVGLENSSDASYRNVIENIKNNIISNFNQLSQDANISEQEVVSFVATMAEKGKYNEALNNVPSSFKKSNSRTFLSAPYFDSLVKMNENLNLHLKSIQDTIQHSNATLTYDVFVTKNLVDYMCLNPNSSAIKTLIFRICNADFESISVQTAASVLAVYNELVQRQSPFATTLLPAIEKCVMKIEQSCTLEDARLTLSEKDTFLTVVQAIITGDALLRYGQLQNDINYISAGRLIIKSYLKDLNSFDLKTLCEMYPLLIHNNKYYPHFEILGTNKGKTIWTWTCANKVSYTKDAAGSISLEIDFPISYTHYLIINGIEPFQSIYIYDIPFRTDYRFETYNSSGYVYQKDSSTLLLKSRQKVQKEIVRLIYTTKTEEKPTVSAAPKSAPEPKATPTTTSTPQPAEQSNQSESVEETTTVGESE